MNIQQLRYFLVLADTLSFTKTAEKYYISQTAVSNQIKALEEKLGVQLFQRDNRKVLLTPAGKVFVKEAKSIITRIEEAVQHTKDAAEGFAGEIHVGYQWGFERTVFPRVLQDFQYEYPNIEILIERDEVAALYDGVMEGKYDIIFNLPLPDKKKSGLKEMVLARYPLYVAVPPQHPFAEFHSLKREQLADEIFISYRQNALSEYDPTQAILADFANVGLVPNINLQHQAIESILLFVALGKGITIVPEYFLPCAPAGINLLFIPLEDSALPAEVAAIWQEKNTNPALDKFVECIQKD